LANLLAVLGEQREWFKIALIIINNKNLPHGNNLSESYF